MRTKNKGEMEKKAKTKKKYLKKCIIKKIALKYLRESITICDILKNIFVKSFFSGEINII